MNRKTILGIALGLAVVIAAGFWLMSVTKGDPSQPTASVPAGPDATAKASEEGDSLPPLKKP